MQLIAHVVIDDAYGAECREVGEKFHTQGEEILVIVAK